MSIDNAKPKEWDNVNQPRHYSHTPQGVECIDYIHQQLGEGLIDFCEGNVIKYIHRWRYKNGLEDLKKAQWYLNRLIQKVEEVESNAL